MSLATVTEAITILGFHQVRNLLLTTSVVDLLSAEETTLREKALALVLGLRSGGADDDDTLHGQGLLSGGPRTFPFAILAAAGVPGKCPENALHLHAPGRMGTPVGAD